MLAFVVGAVAVPTRRCPPGQPPAWPWPVLFLAAAAAAVGVADGVPVGAFAGGLAAAGVGVKRSAAAPGAGVAEGGRVAGGCGHDAPSNGSTAWASRHSTAFAHCSSRSSIPTARRPELRAATKVEQPPANTSRTRPAGGQP